MKTELVAYAQSFVSFFTQNQSVKDLNKIKMIILFGSVARGEASRSSDIDLFIHTIGESKTIERKIESTLIDFGESQLFNKYWKLLGIENDIKPIVGTLENWPDLKQSIISDGIVLYGKYKASFTGKPRVLFYWSKIDKESKRVLFSKQLYGYNQNKKHYLGLLEKYKGKKLGGNCILVDLEAAKEISSAFRKLGITAKRIHLEEIR